MFKTKISDFEKNVPIVKTSDVYDIHDLELEHLTASVTVLHAGKQTRGHAHDNIEEIYFFLNGNGKMLVGEEEIDVSEGDMVAIPCGVFHRVINNSGEDVRLLAVFEKYKRE
jgi:mannose-6-phosphate isomerase-like protein (cupin superfamily)